MKDTFDTLDDNVRNTISECRCRSSVALLHPFRKLHVCLLAGVIYNKV